MSPADLKKFDEKEIDKVQYGVIRSPRIGEPGFYNWDMNAEVFGLPKTNDSLEEALKKVLFLGSSIAIGGMGGNRKLSPGEQQELIIENGKNIARRLAAENYSNFSNEINNSAAIANALSKNNPVDDVLRQRQLSKLERAKGDVEKMVREHPISSMVFKGKQDKNIRDNQAWADDALMLKPDVELTRKATVDLIREFDENNKLLNALKKSIEHGIKYQKFIPAVKKNFKTNQRAYKLLEEDQMVLRNKLNDIDAENTPLNDGVNQNLSPELLRYLKATLRD